jgi:hypothetical protein
VLDDEVGAVGDEAGVDAHDGVAGDDLVRPQEVALQLGDRRRGEVPQHRHVGVARQAVGQHARHHRRRRADRQAW